MLSQLINTGERTTIPLERIKTDGGTQMRAALDPDTVQEYLDAMQPAGWGDFPAIIVYYDGTDHWLADGFHRVEAYRLAAANLDQPANVPADVRSGTRRDAILYAAGANANHGLRRTNADKRRSVETLLRDDDWRHWSDREIARRCNVHHQLVARIRSESSSLDDHPVSERTYTTKHGTAATMQTANIGANQPAAETDEERRQRIRDNDRRMKDEINSRFASRRASCWRPATAPIPAGWDAADEVEYQALLPTWQKPAGDVGAILELDHITRRRVAERLSVERMDNLRFSLQERCRILWLEERRAASPQSPISQSPIPNPSPYKSLAQMDADGEIPPLAPRNPQPDTYASVFAIQSNLRALLASATAADLRTTATHRGGSRWFEARRLLQGATLHYRDRDLVQALNNLADEVEQRERTQPAQPAAISNFATATNGYAAQSQIEEWITQIAATSVELQEASDTRHGRIWDSLVTMAAAAGYELSEVTPRAALRNAAVDRAHAERKAADLPDDRINRALILINHYRDLRAACEDILQREREYEALIGTPSDLLAAHRGMHAIVDTLLEPIAKLEHLVETLITVQSESR